MADIRASHGEKARDTDDGPDEQVGKPIDTPEDQLAALLHRGRHDLTQGQPKDAADTLEEALVLARSLDEQKAEAEAAGLLAQAYLRLGLPDEAAREAQTALTIARACHDEDAARHFEQLLLTARSSPEELEMSTSFGDGRQALTQGEPERAIPHLERALELAEKVGHTVAQGASIQLLAQAYHGAERGDDALRYAKKALEQAQRCGDEQAAARAQELIEHVQTEDEPLLVGLQAELQWGQSALAENDVDRAIRHLSRAKELAQEEGKEIPEAAARGLLAQAYLEQGKREDAAAEARHALEIATRLGHEEAARDFQILVTAAEADERSAALANLLHQGAAALDKQQPQDALSPLRSAVELAEETSHKVGEAIASGLLAHTYQALGDEDMTLAFAQRALTLTESSGDAEGAKRLCELFPCLRK